MRDWYVRFLYLIENDARTMKELSIAAGCGQNYIQQIVKTGKRPSADKFVSILEVLGPLAVLYVFTGLKINPDDLTFLQALSGSDKNKKEAILTLLKEEKSSPK